jgi:RNA ligase (TIGR02306 family)
MEKTNELNDIRKLATIARIEELKSINGADNIEHARIRGWWVVVKKDEFKVGDLCVYIETDSILPDGLSEEKKEAWKALNKQMSKVVTEEDRMILREAMNEIIKENTRPEFEFLRDKKFHIKTRRILGEISQGICFPLSILPIVVLDDFNIIPPPDSFAVKEWAEGDDVTELLGVTQYIPPDPAVMGGDVKGELQAIGILISDEERIENLSAKYEQLKQFTYYKTEKLEGTSFAAYLKNGKFGVCGRTIDYKEPDDDIPFDKMNVYWKVAKQLGLEEIMNSLCYAYDIQNFAIQGELVGEGIQNNIYKLKGQTVCFYNAFDIDSQEYWPYDLFIQIMNEVGLNTVPILDDNFTLPETAKELLEEADRTTTVFGNNPKQLIEGFVLVAKDELTPLTKITRSSLEV